MLTKVAFLFLFWVQANAQISTQEVPVGFKYDFGKEQMYEIVMPALIRASQGLAASGADNLFSANATWNFHVQTINGGINYYYDLSNPLKTPVKKSSNIFLLPATANPCINTFPKMFNLSESEMIEHNNYVSLYIFKNRIKTSGRTIAELNADEIAQMLTFATASQGLSSLMARNILCFFYEICLEEMTEAEPQPNAPQPYGNQSKSAQSVSSEFEKSITIIPNPTTGELRVTSYELQVTSIEVFDIYGRAVSTHHSLLTTHYSIDISNLPTGLYFVKVYTENGVFVEKIIKK